jgi:3-oxoacyl-[acyl-carrier-protein] synthase II
MRRRVKITGIGPVTPAGIGREDFFRGINESVSRVRVITRSEPETVSIIGAEIPGFDLKRYVMDQNPRRLSRHTQFGLAAAILALTDANLTANQAGLLNPIVVTGTSLMDFERISREIHLVKKKGPRGAMASNLYETSLVNVPGKIAELLGPSTRMVSLQTSCCSGLDAVGQAAELVASGQTDLAVAGGSESPLTYHPMIEFNAAELSPSNTEQPEKSCRPFDLWRSTGVMGEGAAMFILEPESSPRPGYAWVGGYGYHSDPDNMAGSGLFEAIGLALANARRRTEEVGYINAWGPGHRVIDANEAQALQRLFGSDLYNIPVSSIKGAIGTALAASGPIQLASAALSLFHGLLPPTVNWETPDPSCPLNLSAQPRRIAANVAVINAHGMLGSNAAVVLEK